MSIKKAELTPIGTILNKNKSNDFMEFLIILNDKNYVSSFFYSSDYDKINNQRDYFPGKLNILNQKDLENQVNDDFIIEGNVMIKKVYTKMPKENIYVDFNNFAEKYFNSKINELISIFSMMNARKIVLSMYNESNEELAVNFSGGINLKNINLELGAHHDNAHNSKLKKKWVISFEENNKPINIIDFTNKRKFYYLPKEPEWIEIIRKRINRGMNKDNYVYNFYDNNTFNTKLFANLNMLKIDMSYNSKKYNNITIEYDVTYYSMPNISKCFICGENGHSSKDCGQNENDDHETSSFYDYLKTFFKKE